jgi:hypothetical protein
MKTSTKIILEDMKLSNEFRFNVELLNNDKLKNNLYTIMSHLDDFNNEKSKESDKLFTLETIVNQFIEVTNALVNEYLFKKQVDVYKQKKTIERIQKRHLAKTLLRLNPKNLNYHQKKKQ